MKKEAGWKKVVAWAVSIIGLLIITLIFAWHYLKKGIQSNDPKAKAIVTKEVKKVVTGESDSLYAIRYTDFHLNIDSGYADITNLNLSADTAIYRKLTDEKKVPNNLITLKAGKIVISNFGFTKVEGKQALHIGRISINDFYAHVTNKVRSYNDTAHTRSLISFALKNLFKSLGTDNIIEIKIDNIFMKNTSLVYVNDNESTPRSTALRHLDITISNVSSGELANKDSTGKADAAIKIGHQKIITGDKLYDVDFDNMRIIPSDKKMLVGTFSLTPRVSKSAFYKVVKAGRANYRYQFTYKGISINNIDFDKFGKRQRIYVPNMTVDDSQMECFTNFNWPLRTPPNRRDKFPNELLQKLAFDVTINKLTVKHGDLYFRIVAKKSQKEALLTLNDIHSVTTNITNNAAAKSINAYTKSISDLKVMNAGLMRSEMVFNLVNKNAPVTLSATVGEMDGTALNPLSEALSMMQIKSAQIEKMETNMKIDEYKATGNIDFYYKNMKVRLLRKDDKGELKKMPVLSFFTNMVLPNDNPKKNGKFRKGPINVIRDPRESFFGFIWRGMLDGMSSAMSGADQTKKEPGNSIIEIGKIFTGPKKGQEEKSAGGDKERLQNLNEKGKRKN